MERSLVVSQTIDQVYRDYRTAGVPASGEHEPDKREIRALLKMIQNSGGQAVTRNTLSALNGVTPPNENYMGVVLTGADAGYYYRSGGAWVFGRAFPDTFAVMTVTGGTANAIVGGIDPALNPSTVRVFALVPTADNTGPVTVNGTALVGFDGQPLEAGFVRAGAMIVFALVDGSYRLLVDHRFQQFAEQVEGWRDETEGFRDEAEAEANRSHDEADRSEAARDIAAGYAGDAVTNGNGWAFSTLLGAMALPGGIPVGVTSFDVYGYGAAGDGGRAQWVEAEEQAEGPGRRQDAAGRWFELAFSEGAITPEMLGEDIQEGLNFVGAHGGRLLLDAKVYETTAKLVQYAPDKSFIVEALPGCIIRRASDFADSVMEFRQCDGIKVRGLSIDAANDVYSSGNHGLVIYDSDNPVVEDVHVVNQKNSGILVYALAGAKKGARINYCSVNGLGVGRVGILISGMKDSGMHGCSAYGITNTGGDGYGLELKNECEGCFITDGYAKDCTAGFVFGQDIGVPAVQKSRVTGVAVACDYGFVSGYGDNNDIDIIVNMAGAALGQFCVDMTQSRYNTVSLTALNIPDNKNVVRLRTGSVDNIVMIEGLDNLPSTSTAVRFDDGSERNTVRLRKMSNPSFPTTGYPGLVSDLATATTNSFTADGYPRLLSAVIVSDAIAIKDPGVQIVRIDTEGAAATDNLATINGPGIHGQIISLETTVNARDVTVQHNTGNILLNGAANFSLDGVADTLTLKYNSTLSRWCEVGRGNNA